MGDDPATSESPGLERRWAAIQSRMKAASPLLVRQGSVASRVTPAGSRVSSVRFVEAIDGRRIQRVIYIGVDPELIRRAREVIATCREHEQCAREVEEAARFVRASNSLIRRMIAT